MSDRDPREEWEPLQFDSNQEDLAGEWRSWPERAGDAISAFLARVGEGLNKASRGVKHKRFVFFTLCFFLGVYLLYDGFSDFSTDLSGFLNLGVRLVAIVSILLIYVFVSVSLFDDNGMGGRTRRTFLKLLEDAKYQRTDILFYLGIVCFSIVSFVSTSSGIVILMGTAEGARMGDIPTFVPYLVSFTVQILIFAVIARVSDRAVNVFAKLVYFCSYVLLLLFSSGFGYGYWYDNLFAESEFYRNVEHNQQRLITVIADSLDDLDAAVSIAGRVYESSDKAFRDEAEVGRQCHPRVPKGEGLRYDYLRKSRDSFAGLYGEMSALRETIPSVEEFEQRIHEAVSGNPASAEFRTMQIADKFNGHVDRIAISIDNFKQVYGELLAEGREIVPDALEYKDLKGTGQELCPLDIKRTFQGLVNSIGQVRKVDSADIFIVNYEDKKEVLQFAFNRFINVVVDLLSFRVNLLERETFNTFLPFLINAFFDLTIFFMAFFVSRGRIRLAQEESPPPT